MSLHIARWLVLAAAVYLAAGLLFAVPFALRWVGRLDPAARAGTWGFRLLIIPGTVLLWPLLARRLLRGEREPPEERNAHRVAARTVGTP
ncbi:MAG: hypothetical protein ACRENB_12205 [Gemmatimonadales bacterium]